MVLLSRILYGITK